nr:tRNA 2-selenouridine(34) synthase MnmH [Metabacillus kandeliae]
MLKLTDQNKLSLIDVRSPSEFKAATIPGSMNIPLFNDEERAEVGTLYKQTGVQAAKDKGLEIFSAKLPSYIKDFSSINGEKAVFCWRGGMRSRTAATVLDLMGIKVYRLNGGIRAYRKWIVDMIETMPVKPDAFVLNGNTGTGKTLILKQLESEGYPIMDLEGMANHRGSIFGQIGLEPHNQKMFDALFIQKARAINHSPFMLFEAESKRIGKVVLPLSIIQKKEQGIQLFIELPMEERVRHILDDYDPSMHHKECLHAFQMIKNRIHTPIAADIEAKLSAGNYGDAAELLLRYYYDPRYEHSYMQYPEDQKISIAADNAEKAAEEIKHLLYKKYKLSAFQQMGIQA